MKTQGRFTVADVEYIVDQLPATVAFDIFLDTIKIVGPTAGPVLAQLFEAASSGRATSIADFDLSSLDLSAVAREFFSGLDKRQLREIAKQLAGVTTVVGKGSLGGIYDLHFAGKQMQHLKWLYEAYKVQFADFFDALSKTFGSAPTDQQ